MNNNYTKYGFTLISSEPIAPLSSTLHMLEHTKTGAKLAFHEREDRNMTFAIAFRTPPRDDTGVFHILEHSVLCGSKKYPVKEPFVELLKSSLNTFLNAMTYEDRTVYPVASRCEKDFINLTDIYLDAVFHPRILECENIFRQEGWHLEYDGESLSYNGVVYNEMHGAYSSPDEMAGLALRRSLFKDNLYRFESGGLPEAIPELSYEDFVDAYTTYYHPSNSYIFLDGSVDTDKLLPLIASYLDEYEKKDINVEYPIHAPHDSPAVRLEFEPTGDLGAKVLIAYGCPSVGDSEMSLALPLMTSVIAGTNDAPLKRAILDSGMCEDVMMHISGTCQSQLTLELIGIKEDRIEGAEDEINSIIRDIVNKGLDSSMFDAAINNAIFRLRERDHGSTPEGIFYALAAYSRWIYGHPITPRLNPEPTYEMLREKLSGDYFGRLLLSSTVDNPHKARVFMIPREGYDLARREEAEAAMARLTNSMTEQQLEDIAESARTLKEWQDTPDTEENLSTLPTLSLSDVTEWDHMTSFESYEHMGAKIMVHNVGAVGISYVNIEFICDDLDQSELPYLTLLTSMLRSLDTEHYSVSELQKEIKSSLGSLICQTTVYPTADGFGGGTLAMTVSSSALEEKRDNIPRLVEELLLTTRFDNRSIVEEQIVQSRSYYDESFAAQSLSFAIGRVGSAVSRAGAINEMLSGYKYYTTLREICATLPESLDSICDKLASLLSRLCIRERMTVSVTGEGARELAERIISAFPSGEVGERAEIPLSEQRNEGLAVPVRVAHSVIKAISPRVCEHLGTLRVASSILSYEYLWGAIRVKGGAYGAGLSVKKAGEIAAYSYRDPSPIASIEAIRRSPEFLRELAREGRSLTGYIIGAIGEYDIITTPSSRLTQAVYDYRIGWTKDMERRMFESMINTDSQSLLVAADIIESAFEAGAVCISANRETLDAITPPLHILEAK